MGLFGGRINPATGRPHRDDKKIKALSAREDRKADAAIKLTERLHQQKLKRQVQQDQSRRKSWWN